MPTETSSYHSGPGGRHQWMVIFQCAACLLLPGILAAQTAQPARSATPPDGLHQLNNSIEALVQRVSPSVVQIMVTGFESAEERSGGHANEIVGRRQAIGSGVIVDPDGYIVTNAHVVNGAEKIEAIVPPRPMPGAPADVAEGVQGKSYQARIVGVAPEIDLAVLKIETHTLPAISLRGPIRTARQGELVFAFGSPEGLRGTVTMGVVSAVARQPDPDSPLVYIQTDTPINPGNSGGPLVDADGQLVGINTFILSVSGGNQGLGFAIPAGVVASAYPQLLRYGHVHQPTIGALVQTITPELAAGVHLERDYGVIVSDVLPGGPAETAGLKVQDIILSVDGNPITTLPLFAQSLYLHKSGEHARIEVLRGTERVPLNILLVNRPHKEDSLVDIADTATNLVESLGILGVELTIDLATKFPDLRIPTGVIVAATTLGSGTEEIPLQTGDVIHSLNGTPITTLAGLREALAKQKPGDAIALYIERYGQLIYVSFSL